MAETQEPQGTTSPAATELSTHEWEDQMAAGYGGEAQPTGGDRDSGRTLTDLVTGSPAKSQATPPLTGNPLVRWVKNLARGAATGVNEMARTATEVAVATKRSRFGNVLRSVPIVGTGLDAAATALSENVDNDPEKAKAAKDMVVSEAQLNEVYGPKPKDTVGSIIHGAGQFVSGTALMTPLVGFPAAAALSGGTAFDPYEQTLADIGVQHEKALNELPIAGRMIFNASRALQVDPQDDSPVEARIKKAIEGEVVGRTTMLLLRPVFRGMAAGWKAARAAKAGDEAGVKAAQAEAANIHAPEADDVVEVRPTEDGNFEVTPVQELRDPLPNTGGRPTQAANNYQDALDQYFGNAPGEDRILHDAEGNPLVRVALSSRGGDVVELKTIENLAAANRSGNPTKVMQELVRMADEHNVTLTLQASPFGEKALSRESLRDFYRKFGFEQTKHGDANMVRRPGDTSPEFRETGNGVGPEGPAPKATYTDEAAARSDAATINALAYENGRAAPVGGMFTPDEVALHARTAEALKAGDVGSLETNPHFNLQSIGATDDVNAQIGALTTQYSDLFSVAQGRPSVPNEVLHDSAARWASEVKLDNFLPAMQSADAAGRVALSLKAALYNAAVKQAGQEVAEIGMLMAAKPGDEALEILARKRLETFLRVSEATANFNTELGRGLQALSARSNPSAAAIRFGSEVTPRPSIMQPPAAPTPQFRPLNPQGLSPERLAAYVRLFARSGGDMRIVPHVMDAIRKEQAQNVAGWAASSMATKTTSRLVSIFINGIISGFKTMATIATSGATLNAFQASAKILAGAGTANRGLAEEGAAAWGALFYYTRRNMRGAWAAFKENRSILDGTPPFHVDPNPLMKAVQVPGRVAGSLDEFTRTAAYHADEFSRAFRQARNEGLSLVEAAKRADYDVTLSIDQATGIGLNPAALKRAGIPTLSDHLGNDTFIGKIANTLAEYPASKFAVPFVRPSVNTFRFAWANTPLLNKFNRDAQQIFLRGGEEATVLHTQAALTGTMMFYAGSQWMDGSITGAGPKDPHLRAEWEKNHQPYSVKINGEWHSYRRAEPFATFLGLVTDSFEIYHELPEEDRDELQEKMEGVFTAIMSAGARNVTSKSWTESLLNFFSALDDKDGPATKRYLQGVVRGLVPYSAAIKQFNDDPVWREARDVFDGVRAQIPGWSDDLPARFDWSGEKRARQGSMWNRNFSIFPSMSAAPSVEDALVDSYIRLAPPNPRPYKGIDMWDKRWARADGKVPYEVFMEKLAATGIRKQVEEIVKSEGFQKAPKGSQAYPQSLRGDLVQSRVGDMQTVALNQMLAEFSGPGGFAEAFNRARYVIPVIGKYEGSDAANAMKEQYGIPTEVGR
jgi:hypothetical protein